MDEFVMDEFMMDEFMMEEFVMSSVSLNRLSRNELSELVPVSKLRCAGLLVLLIGALFVAACGGAQRHSPPKNVILITVDTWRGDHLSAQRAGQALTPELTAWASRMILFADASSVGTQTSPGVAGILTGLFPYRSGVVSNQHVLPATVPTLASKLREAGFVNAAVVANPLLRAGFGFEAGFDHYELVERASGEPKARASELVHRALGWLDERPTSRRFFLWLHFMEPHGPYVPPQDVLALFPSEQFDAPRELELLAKGDNSGRGGIPHYQWKPIASRSRDGRDYLARYAAEVRDLDGELGRLLVRLERDGLLDDSAVVLSSDHGEALAGDNGFYFSHGNELTQDQVHVPLLVYYPGCTPGAVVANPVSTVDIFPTVLAILGLPEQRDVDGRNLLAEAESDVMSETLHEVSLRAGSWKLRAGKTAPRAPRFFDLALDPREDAVRPVAAERARELGTRLRELRARPRQAPSISRFHLDEERRRELEELGYL